MTLSLTWDNEAQRADLKQDADGRLVLGDALEAAVTISLFTRAPARRGGDGVAAGWWGDTFASRPIGSKLWSYARGVTTRRELRQMEVDAQAALAWLIDDGIARSVAVSVTRHPTNTEAVGIDVTITRGDGTIWQKLWREVLPGAI